MTSDVASARGPVGPSKNLSCQIGSNIDYLDSALRRIRVAWREKQCQAWLKSKSRRDAAIARSFPVLHIPEKQVEEVCHLIKKHNAHFLVIITGVCTLLRWTFPVVNLERMKQMLPPVSSCPYCNQETIPCMDHILWSCQVCEHLLSGSPPSVSTLAQDRLEWFSTTFWTFAMSKLQTYVRLQDAPCRPYSSLGASMHRLCGKLLTLYWFLNAVAGFAVKPFIL